MSHWIKAIPASRLKPGQRGCLNLEGQQIALFHFQPDEWYAVQNRCTHQNQNVISRGITGDVAQEPTIACPLHKNRFSLRSGKCLSAELAALACYPVKVVDGQVMIQI